tara:strand:- start:74 stop:484 length:411 start_codon:yes stop_codon:yes gene_type:complete
MNYIYRAVERIPVNLENGVVYHSEDFELAGFLCPCGCGHRITLLVPDSHQVWSHNGLATINPSVGVFDAPCKSHFFIRAGAVDWLSAFSGAQATSIMEAQIARHAARDRKPSWFDHIGMMASSILRFVRTMFGGRT